MKKLLYLATMIVSSAFASQTIECNFTSYSNKAGNHKDEINLTFEIDNSNEKAYMVGNIGTSEVAYIGDGMGQSFIEITAFGNVTATTIDEKLQAVHSRNSVGFDGELIPSQYYGSCVKK